MIGFLLLTAGAAAQPDSLPPWGMRDIAVNNIRMYVNSDGSLAYHRQATMTGFEWPVNSGKHLIFDKGILVSARDVSTGKEHLFGVASTTTSLQPGPILQDGSPGDPQSFAYRIYRARRTTRAEFKALPAAEQQQLREDFLAWPVQLGAPWHDGDGNGRYAPDFDAFLDGASGIDTPLFPGKEVLWFVSNSMDSSRCADFYSQQPLPIEVHTLVWASPGDTVLNNTVFTRQTVINRSTVTFDSVYIGHWCDPDIGWSLSDRVGIDTALAMPYAYNGVPWDDVYSLPPAVGEVWLQTPVVPSAGARAMRGFRSVEGYRNLPLRSFVFFTKDRPNPYYGPWGDDGHMLHNALRGLYYDGESFVDPLTGDTSTIVFPGDPVTGSGWHDAVTLSTPYERYMLSAVGPMTLAPGDTQEVVIATTVGSGISHLNSVAVLRRNAHVLHALYPGTLGAARITNGDYAFAFPDTAHFDLHAWADVDGATAVHAVLRYPDGSIPVRFPLFDDGQHEDGGAGDGRYGGRLLHETLPSGADLCIEATGQDGSPAIHVAAYALPLPGPLAIRQSGILSDHLNFDGHANPGEHCRLDIEIRNRSRFALGGFLVEQVDQRDLLEHARLDTMLTGGEGLSLVSRDAYFTTAIPKTAVPGSRQKISLVVLGDQYCRWTDTVEVDIEAFSPAPKTGLLAHTAGLASGTLGWQHVADTDLKLHRYEITVQGEDWEKPTLTVTDQTASRVLASAVPLPDRHGHDSPEFDGWKLSLGTALYERIYDQQGYPQFLERDADYAWSAEDRAWFTLYEDEVQYMQTTFWSAHDAVSVFETYPVAIVFDRHGAPMANAYLRGASPVNYAYFGQYPCIARAYDMRDSSAPRQLCVSFVEQNGSAFADSSWTPGAAFADREILLISDLGYEQIDHTRWQLPLHEESADKRNMFVVFGMRSGEEPDFRDGDTLWVLPRVPVSRRDTYVLDLTALDIRPTGTQPGDFTLEQNYPNPVRDVTEIRFTLPRATSVTLTVSDALGREVRRLRDGIFTAAGAHRARFNAAGLPPGLYFYRLQAGGEVRTRKMVLAH
ncbi:MAG: T9SS type A sorting domain-containing protein [Bacteroidota bacterium]|nr:T9SS type A sorting domain-containing protein [Bacteroidota bacterium]